MSGTIVVVILEQGKLVFLAALENPRSTARDDL